MVERGHPNTPNNDDIDDTSEPVWGEWYVVQRQGIGGHRIEKLRRDARDAHGTQVAKDFMWKPKLSEIGVSMGNLAPYLPKPIQGGTRTLVFAEGESDTDTLNALCVPDEAIRVVGLQSANWAPSKDWITKYCGEVHTIILFPDHDDVGRDAMRKVSSLFLELMPHVKQSWIKLDEDSPKGFGATDVASEVIDLVGDAIEHAEDMKRVNVDDTLTDYYREKDPDPVPSDSFIGVFGRIIKKLSPYTIADDHCLMATLVSVFGVLVGPSPKIPHPIKGNPQTFNLIVGDPNSGKGTSWDLIRDEVLNPLLELLGESNRYYEMVTTSVNSGEGIVYKYGQDNAEPCQLWVLEEAKVFFTAMARQDSTVDVVTRQLWDRVPLAINTKNPIRADVAAGSLLMHIPPQELTAVSKRSDASSGLFRRMTFQKSIPKDIKTKRIPRGLISLELEDLEEVMRAARTVNRVWFTEQGEKKWDEIMERFKTRRVSFMSQATASASARIARWALVFALVDRNSHPELLQPARTISEPDEFRGAKPEANIITEVHLQAALDFEIRSQQTLEGLFMDKEFSSEARTLLDALENAKDGELTQSDISRGVFSRNKNSDELYPFFRELIEAGRIRPQEGINPKTGRKVKIWRLIQLA